MVLDEGPLVHAELAQTPKRSCPQLFFRVLLLHASEGCSARAGRAVKAEIAEAAIETRI